MTITTGLTVFGLFFESSKRKLINTVIELCLDDVFRGAVESYRITIYKKRYGVFAFYHHVSRCFLFNGWTHFKKNLLWHYFKSTPSLNKSYLLCYSRSGHPHHCGSSTKFLVADSKSEVNGIVSHVEFSQQPYKVNLPDLGSNEIFIYRNISEVTDLQLKENLLEHMRKGHIKCFDRLRSMHRLPTHVWASPILGPDEDIWGVLIMDCVTDKDPFTHIQAFEEKITIYVRTIESILKQ